VAPSIERLSKLINKTWLIYLFILSIICTNYLLLVSVRDWFKTKIKLLWFKVTFLNKNELFDKIILSFMHCISFRPAKFYALCQAKMVIIFKNCLSINSIHYVSIFRSFLIGVQVGRLHNIIFSLSRLQTFKRNMCQGSEGPRASLTPHKNLKRHMMWP
jgi:hypothetical protein